MDKPRAQSTAPFLDKPASSLSVRNALLEFWAAYPAASGDRSGILRPDNPIRIFLTGARQLGIELARDSDVRTSTVLVSAVIVTLGALGALRAFGVVDRHEFDLDAEWVLAAYFSCGLLCAAAGLAFLIGNTVVDGGIGREWRQPGPMDRGQSRIWWRLIGCFFVFMAIDELVSVHERVESVTGVDWQQLYLPIVFLGGVAWLFYGLEAVATARRLCFVRLRRGTVVSFTDSGGHSMEWLR
jgi:hypothetical protein